MLKRMMTGVAAFAIAFGVGSVAQGAELNVGEAAPELEHVDWLKGEAVESWKSGEVYVLDFWATWCGPCVASIPHINKLQKEYADDGVHVIGVAIWPREGMTPTDEFVEARGDEMGYRIAEDVDGKTAEAFMNATGSRGIPTVMVVDKQGRLAWVGHPMSGLDEVLEEIVAGEFDISEAAAEFQEKVELARREMALQQQAAPIMQELQQAYQAQNWDRMVDLFGQLIEMDKEVFGRYATQRYYIVADRIGDAERAERIGKEILSDYGDNSQMMNEMAWVIATQLETEERDLDLALRAARMANKETDGESARVLDTLARVHFERGEMKEAIEVQERAIKHAEGDEALLENLRESMAMYQEASGVN